MAGATSNLAAIEKALNDLVGAISFTSKGLDAGMGQDLAKLIALGIRDRVIARVELPDGSTMPANEPVYAARKGGRPVSILGGEMMSEVELTGTIEVSAHSLTMSYGTGDDTRRRAQWFTNGSPPGTGQGEPSGAINQPARPFYEMDDVIEAQIDKYLDDYAADVLKRL